MQTTTKYPTPVDAECAEFLKRLDAAPFDVSDWEAKFIESNLDRTEFTPSQRLKIEQLRRDYSHRL